jgi:hypothetical protein
MDVFFLCPGGVLVLFSCVTGIRTDKEPTGQKSFVCFGTSRCDTEFRFRLSILFLKSFLRAVAQASQPAVSPIPIRGRFHPHATLIGGTPIRALLFALGSLFR